MSIFSAVSDLIIGSANAGIQAKQNKQNLAFQREQFEAQKAQQALDNQWREKDWNENMRRYGIAQETDTQRYNTQLTREDTALQRRKKDALESGFSAYSVAGGQGASSAPSSPILMSSSAGKGGSAPTSAPRGEAPQMSPIGDPVEGYLNLQQMRKNIAQTEAQTQQTKALTATETINSLLKQKEYERNPKITEQLDEQIKALRTSTANAIYSNSIEREVHNLNRKYSGSPAGSKSEVGRTAEDVARRLDTLGVPGQGKPTTPDNLEARKNGTMGHARKSSDRYTRPIF